MLASHMRFAIILSFTNIEGEITVIKKDFIIGQ